VIGFASRLYAYSAATFVGWAFQGFLRLVDAVEDAYHVEEDSDD
jgi:hypothetical protein